MARRVVSAVVVLGTSANVHALLCGAGQSPVARHCGLSMSATTASVDSWYDAGVRLSFSEEEVSQVLREMPADFSESLEERRERAIETLSVASWYDAGVRLEEDEEAVAAEEAEEE